MDEVFLHRADAPFGDEVWKLIDETVIRTAKTVLAGRRLLYIDGPYGLGFASLPGGDKVVEDNTPGGISVSTVSPIPIVLIRSDFTIPKRDIAVYEKTGIPFNPAKVVKSTLACAEKEDSFIFHGHKEMGMDGLLTAKGVQKSEIGDWAEVGAAAENVIKAITALDNAGFHGPYAGAFTSDLYNKLFRKYPYGGTELEHLGLMLQDGVIKSSSIKNGGVVLATGKQYASIIIGQDMAAGFTGPSGGDYEMTVSESLALNLKLPGSVCVME